jgi:hypothetical protein
MKTEIFFEEVLQFSKKPVRDFFRFLMGIIFIAVIFNLILQKGRMTDFNLALTILLSLLLITNIILASKLIMQIREDGIYVRFPPWQPLASQFFWTDISEVYVRNYDSMKEFFGWGIRIQPRRTGYIVAGNTGIEIVLKNGNKVLITTHQPEAVNEVIRTMEKL